MTETTTPGALPPEPTALPMQRSALAGMPAGVPGEPLAEAAARNDAFAALLAAALGEDASVSEPSAADAASGMRAPESRAAEELAAQPPSPAVEVQTGFPFVAIVASAGVSPTADPDAQEPQLAASSLLPAARDEARAPAAHTPSPLAGATAAAAPVRSAEAPGADPPASRTDPGTTGEALASAPPRLAPVADSAPLAPAAAATVLPLPRPYGAQPAPRPGAPGFDTAFATQVRVAVLSGAQSASIALEPPELGPVEVQIELRGVEAHVCFAAAHASAREAIADALPRLRELLAAHGIELAGSSVGEELPQRRAPEGERTPGNGAGAPRAAGTQTDAAPSSLRIASRLVDTFA